MAEDIKVITVTNNLERAVPLVKSLQQHGWDFEVIKAEWRGFGTKLITTYQYLKAHPEIKNFIFCDAHDVLALGTPEEFISKLDGNSIILSAERGLWPPILQPFRCKYATTTCGFNYINSGLYYAETSEFFYLFEKYPPFYEIDDQYWLNMAYLMEEASPIQIDYEQTVFNSHSFLKDGEYTYKNGRVQIIGNEPVFIHFNGQTVDEKFNQMLNGLTTA